MNKSKVAIPLKMHDLIWNDDSFYREIESSKKFTHYKFPRCDQWCDESGFYLSFALAGYSPDDIYIEEKDNIINISSENKEGRGNMVQQGMIIRGIAKRSFNIGFVISPEYNAKKASSKMVNGLLQVFVPINKDSESNIINVRSE